MSADFDLVIALRDCRRRAGLKQGEAAKRAEVGVKSLSSWETGLRIDGLHVTQLLRLLAAYGISPAQFFAGEPAPPPPEPAPPACASAQISESAQETVTIEDLVGLIAFADRRPRKSSCDSDSTGLYAAKLVVVLHHAIRAGVEISDLLRTAAAIVSSSARQGATRETEMGELAR